MNIPLLAADIADRIPAMAQDCKTNNCTLIESIIQSELQRHEPKFIDWSMLSEAEIAALKNQPHQFKRAPWSKSVEVELQKTIDALDSYGREWPDAPAAAEAALKDLNFFRQKYYQKLKEIQEAVEHAANEGWIEHEPDCPQDDTCDCTGAVLFRKACQHLTS